MRESDPDFPLTNWTTSDLTPISTHAGLRCLSRILLHGDVSYLFLLRHLELDLVGIGHPLGRVQDLQ